MTADQNTGRDSERSLPTSWSQSDWYVMAAEPIQAQQSRAVRCHLHPDNLDACHYYGYMCRNRPARPKSWGERVCALLLRVTSLVRV